MTEEFDAVIIGSGAGGAPIAYELARAGRSVLVLEKGPGLRTQEDSPEGLSDFKRDELYANGPEKVVTLEGVSNQGASYYSSHVEPDLNDEPHLYSDHTESNVEATIEGYTAQVTGGGTQLYGAVHLRFAEDDFRLASFNEGRTLREDPDGDALDAVRDWPVSYEQMRPYYEKTEHLIGINGTSQNQLKPFHGTDHYQRPVAPNPIGLYAFNGMKAMGMKAYRTPLAVITEAHEPSGRPEPDYVKTGYVNRYGDPLGYKSNTWVALLRPTLRSHPDNLTLRNNCTVTHLKSEGRRVTGVVYRDPSGREVTVSGKQVIVACSAIESVRLLMISAEEDRAGFGQLIRYEEEGTLLGRYFLTHCFGGAKVMIKGGRFDKSISLDSDWATDFCARGEFLDQHGLWAGAAIYNNTSDSALPISMARTYGAADLDRLWAGFLGNPDLVRNNFQEWLDRDFGTNLSVSFMANQIPWWKNHIRLSNVRDKWGRKSAHIIKQWHPHDRHLMEVMAGMCRDVLVNGVPDTHPDEVAAGSVYDLGVRIANHILGGARFGSDPEDSVLDPDCRAWNFDNLYVTDGCFMPTSGGANPTHTIEANAFRVADHLKTRF